MTTSRISDALVDMEFDRESGSLLLRGAAAQLYLGWEGFLRTLLLPHASETVVSPGIINLQLVDDSGYGENFPHQLVATHPLGFLPPAACLSVFSNLANRSLPAFILTTARCGRNEDQQWELPFRLRSFTMLELVLVAGAREVATKRGELVELVGAAFSRLDIPWRLVAATDAFFLGEKSGAQLLQRLKGLKREFVPSHDRVPPIALCSVNNHERYFANRFGFGEDDTESTCIAFGLERLTAAGLLIWGPSPNDWPKELRS